MTWRIGHAQLALPAEPRGVLNGIVAPTLALLPARMTGDAARRMLLAIGLQESGFRTRRQLGGPAHGLWMFEKAGVAAVLTHRASRVHAQAICAARGVPATAVAVYGQLEHDDVLACAFARLLLFTDPYPLPALDDEADAWELYLRTWRPGKPRREDWTGNDATAREAIRP